MDIDSIDSIDTNVESLKLMDNNFTTKLSGIIPNL